MTLWRGNDQENDILLRLVSKLVGNLWLNLDPLAFVQADGLFADVHGPSPFEDIKELAREVVIVPDLGPSRRDAFLDDTQVVTLK
jgi:hypothetical protein